MRAFAPSSVMAFAPMLMRCSGKGGKARGIGAGPGSPSPQSRGGGRKAEISTKFAVARMRALARCPRAAQGGNFFLDAWSRTLTHPCKPGMEVENDIFIDRLVDELIDKVCIRILKSFSGRLEHDSFQFPCIRVYRLSEIRGSVGLWEAKNF